MKELSVEEKAKAYDEAIKVAHEYWDSPRTCIDIDVLPKLFPELAESEDERIRKWIKKELESKYVVDNIVSSVMADKALAWLENQGAKVSAIEGFESEFERQVSSLIASAINKEHEYNQDYVKWTANALLNYAKHELEKQSEQKPTDKVEPKFHEGDWVFIEEVKGYKNGPFQIKTVDSFGYSFDKYYTIPFMYEDLLSKWSIQDAKDGDVLTNDTIVLIVDHLGTFENRPIIYSWYFADPNKFYGMGPSEPDRWEVEGFHPATKEQRDFLFQKMHEAGYEWNAEKKELRKVEQNPTEDVDLPEFESYLCLMFQKFRTKGMCTNGEIIDYVKEHSQKLRDILVNPAWSEEDEMIALSIEQVMNCASLLNIVPEKVDKIRTWLKSLKNRVQPKQEWSEEDNIILNRIIADYERSNEEWFKAQNSLPHGRKITWLKSLKDRVQQQPKQEWSEEDLYKIENALFGTYAVDVATKLLNRIKSLRPQKQ